MRRPEGPPAPAAGREVVAFLLTAALLFGSGVVVGWHLQRAPGGDPFTPPLEGRAGHHCYLVAARCWYTHYAIQRLAPGEEAP